MSQSTILILLPETAYVSPGDGSAYKVVGDKQPAAAYYLGNRDLQTVQYSLTDCTGNLVIEASLSSHPSEDEWFTVFSLEANNDAPVDSDAKKASNAKSFANIEGNFVFIRASIRDFKNGKVDFVKVSY